MHDDQSWRPPFASAERWSFFVRVSYSRDDPEPKKLPLV